MTTADGNKTATMTLTVTINYILRQKKVLVALYEAMGGDSWMKKDGWKRDDVELKDWYGITMEGEHVVSINLSNNNLKGKLSASLVEDLVNTIGYLRDLDLSINDISGSIPPQIGNLSNLTNLNLGSNELTGTVPDELGKLSKLENLNISDNKLTGIISIDLQNSDMWKNLKEEPNLKQKDGIELKKETEGSTIDMQGGATHEGYQ